MQNEFKVTPRMIRWFEQQWNKAGRDAVGIPEAARDGDELSSTIIEHFCRSALERGGLSTEQFDYLTSNGIEQ